MWLRAFEGSGHSQLLSEGNSMVEGSGRGTLLTPQQPGIREIGGGVRDKYTLPGYAPVTCPN